MSPWIRFTSAFIFLLLLVSGGTLGYHWIEGWSLWDSLYMTVITVTTVGFREVHEMSQAGEQFTVVLLVSSILTVGYSVTTLIGLVFGGQILHTVRRRKMEREITGLSGHYIICGGGVVGKEIASEFGKAGVSYVVVDENPEGCELGRDESVLFVAGNAEDDDVLIEAGIERARGLVTALREDDANVFVVLTARTLNSDLTIVSRSAEERTIGKLLKAGADRVFGAQQILGQRMASTILRPSVVNFLDVVVEGEDVSMRLEEVRISEDSPLVGKHLRETNIGQETGAIVVGILDAEGKARIDPSATAVLSTVVLQPGDVLIALGNEDQLRELMNIADSQISGQ